jgi:hypothetical protein
MLVCNSTFVYIFGLVLDTIGIFVIANYKHNKCTARTVNVLEIFKSFMTIMLMHENFDIVL